MLQIVQYLVLSLYAALPLGMLVWALAAGRRRRLVWPVISFLLVCLVGVVGGSAFLMLDRRVTGGRLPYLEIARVLYFAVGIVCALKWLDRALLAGAFRLARVKLDKSGRPISPAPFRALGMLMVQRLVLLAIAIPFVASLVMTYRPKMLLEGDPKGKIKADFAAVRFYARDGTELAGWWIPAARSAQTRSTDAEVRRSTRTVVICHGVGSGKEDELGLADLLIRNDYNVFLFDFRGCGESGGTFVTFGDRERLDVRAAVRWIKANHGREAQKLYGIGINTGAAALLAAAEGAASGIDAVVLYEPFARLKPTAEAALRALLPAPVSWLVRNIGLPMACVQSGSDLLDFAPAEDAYKLWPRPALVVHGRGTTFVPVWQEMELYQELLQPKLQFWPAEAYSEMRDKVLKAGDDADMLTEMFRQWIGTSGRISEDQGVREATMRFLREAQAVPVL
jgi:fermentation-respiration switch protein FrsA (DUF1100 family)